MSTLKDIKRIQKIAVNAMSGQPAIQAGANAATQGEQPSKLQQLIDAVASKRGISTGVGMGVGGATGYSFGAATGMSPKAKMLATILGTAAGGTAGNLFAKQSKAKYAIAPEDKSMGTVVKEESGIDVKDVEPKDVPAPVADAKAGKSKLQLLLEGVDKTQAATTAGGAALGAGAGVGGAALMGGSGRAKILAGILGGIGGGAAGHVYGPKMVGKMQGMMGKGK